MAIIKKGVVYYLENIYGTLVNMAKTIEEQIVQSDWNETNTSDGAYIKNKPSIPAGPYTSTGAVKYSTDDSAYYFDGTAAEHANIITKFNAGRQVIVSVTTQGGLAAKASVLYSQADSTNGDSFTIAVGTTNVAIAAPSE